MLRVLLLIDDYNELLYLQTVLKKIGFDVEGLSSQKKYSDASLGFNPQVLVATAKGKKVDALSLGQTIRRTRGIPKIIALKKSNVPVTREEMDSAGLDAVIESPVNVQKLVVSLSELGNIDESGFLAKLEKLNASPEAVTAQDLDEIKSLDGLDDAQLEEIKAKENVNDILGIKDEVQIVTGDVGDDASSEHVKGSGQPSSPFPEKTTEAYQVSEGSKEARNKRFENYMKTMEKPEPGQFERDRILEFNKMIRERGTSEDIEDVEDERKRFVKALFTDEEKD